MEKTVSRKKRVYLFFFGLVLYENATNAVSHRMHGIRF